MSTPTPSSAPVGLRDPRRLSGELHEDELQSLFAVTLALSMAAESAPGPLARRLLSAVDDINDAIGKVRTAVRLAA